MLSEHTCQGMLQGYTLTGRTGLFPSYEAFLGIVHTMMVQYSKFVKMVSVLPLNNRPRNVVIDGYMRYNRPMRLTGVNQSVRSIMLRLLPGPVRSITVSLTRTPPSSAPFLISNLHSLEYTCRLMPIAS